MDLQVAMNLAEIAAKKSRTILLDYFGKIKNIEKKHMAGLVTEADKLSEKSIIEVLAPFGVKITGEKWFTKWEKENVSEGKRNLVYLYIEKHSHGC